MTAYEIFRPTADQWEDLRELRLRALADTPIAYGESSEDALRADEDEWRFRARRALQAGNVQVVARLTEGPYAGEWVGTMAGFVSRGEPPYARGVAPEDLEAPLRANLVAVFVDPRARGRGAGVTDALLDAVAAWVRTEGLGALYLHVHERNPRAAAYYARRGFTFTGAGHTSIHGGVEREMVLPLD